MTKQNVKSEERVQSNNISDAQGEIEIAVRQIAHALHRRSSPPTRESSLQPYLPWVQLLTLVFGVLAMFACFFILYYSHGTAQDLDKLKTAEITEAANAIKTSAEQIANIPAQTEKFDEQVTRLKQLPRDVQRVQEEMEEELRSLQDSNDTGLGALKGQVVQLQELQESAKNLVTSKCEFDAYVKGKVADRLFLMSQTYPQKVRLVLVTDNLWQSMPKLLPKPEIWRRLEQVSGWSIEEGIILDKGDFKLFDEFGGLDKRTTAELDKYKFVESCRHLLLIESPIEPPKPSKNEGTVFVDVILVVNRKDIFDSVSDTKYTEAATKHLQALARWSDFCLKHNGLAQLAICEFVGENDATSPTDDSKEMVHEMIRNFASPRMSK